MASKKNLRNQLEIEQRARARADAQAQAAVELLAQEREARAAKSAAPPHAPPPPPALTPTQIEHARLREVVKKHNALPIAGRVFHAAEAGHDLIAAAELDQSGGWEVA